MRAPAFQFYPADFMIGTMDLSAEAVGAYIRLLCYQWDKGAIPDDDEAIGRIGGCSGNTVVSIRNKFGRCSDGLLRNTRLELVRQKQDSYRATQTQNIQKRWKGHKKDTVVLPPVLPNGYSPSPSPSPTLTPKIPIPSPAATDAEIVYALYPRKVGKPSALVNIKQALKRNSLTTLCEATTAYAEAVSAWPDDRKQFIPHPSRWFKDGRYDDDRATWIYVPRDTTVSWQRKETTDEEHAKGF